jgi:nicotinic acid phosphoribosyltransferase
MNDQEFTAAVQKEIAHARTKFPGSEANGPAMIEEVGEVCKALMYEPWQNVVAECVQVAAMAQRLATEGDDTMRAFREKHVHDFGKRYGLPEHRMPPEVSEYADLAPERE